METLRIYPSVGVLPKWNYQSPHTLVIEGRQVLLPANTMVNVCMNALHLNPKYWGSNPLEYRPQNWDKRCESRWPIPTPDMIETSSDGNTHSGSIRTPLEGSYMPFGMGPRSCLGKRFAQVEFTAVLTRILRSYRVELALRNGETWVHARAKAMEVLEGSLSNPTLKPQTSVSLKLVGRDEVSA